MWNPLYFWFVSAGITSLGSGVLLVWPSGFPPSVATVPEVTQPTAATTTPAIVPTTPTTTPATRIATSPTTPSTKLPITPTTKPHETTRKPNGSVTVYIADTKSLRGKYEMWRPIFERIANDKTLREAFGDPLLRWVDTKGERDWDGSGNWPKERDPIDDEDWNAILIALGRASEKSDCAPRVLWLVENSSHPDKLADRDRLKPIDALLPTNFSADMKNGRKKVTLIWHGHDTPSDDLQERFPAGSKAPNRRLITLKEFEVTYESFIESTVYREFKLIKSN